MARAQLHCQCAMLSVLIVTKVNTRGRSPRHKTRSQDSKQHTNLPNPGDPAASKSLGEAHLHLPSMSTIVYSQVLTSTAKVLHSSVCIFIRGGAHLAIPSARNERAHSPACYRTKRTKQYINPTPSLVVCVLRHSTDINMMTFEGWFSY